jgi:hypothetical protein
VDGPSIIQSVPSTEVSQFGIKTFEVCVCLSPHFNFLTNWLIFMKLGMNSTVTGGHTKHHTF